MKGLESTNKRPSTRPLTTHEVRIGIGVSAQVNYELAEPFGHLQAGERIIITRSGDAEGNQCLVYGRVWEDPEGQQMPLSDVGQIPIIRDDEV